MAKIDPRIKPKSVALLRILDLHDVRYVLFGSVGAVAYGAHLVPGDLDICPEPSAENLSRLAGALAELRAKPRYTPRWNTAQECADWKPTPLVVETFDHLFETTQGDFDVVPAPYGPGGKEDRFTFASLDVRAETVTTFGVPVRVAHLDDLIASKMSRQRQKDLRAFPELARLQQEARARESGE